MFVASILQSAVEVVWTGCRGSQSYMRMGRGRKRKGGTVSEKSMKNTWRIGENFSTFAQNVPCFEENMRSFLIACCEGEKEMGLFPKERRLFSEGKTLLP